MSKLSEDSYPDNDEGWARMRLARIAHEIAAHRVRPLDANTRMFLVIEMHKIDRDDLPEDKRPLYDEFRTHLDME